MSTWADLRECLICGSQNAGVRVQLVEWRDPPGRKYFESVPRCDDRSACQGRVQAKGEKWPVREGART